jgi:phospholipid/cholesterol/gamma-HCH transport system substrate-binding protein
MDLWVGVFVAAGLAGLLFLSMKVGNMSGFSVTNGYTLHAYFDNVGGLKVRAPVKSAGVVVGRVAEINFDNQRYEADVVVKIDGRFTFPKDTSASILTSGLLGEQYIGLDAGGDDQTLKDGDKFQITQSAVVLEKLISQFLYGKASEGDNGKK